MLRTVGQLVLQNVEVKAGGIDATPYACLQTVLCVLWVDRRALPGQAEGTGQAFALEPVLPLPILFGAPKCMLATFASDMEIHRWMVVG